MRKLETEEVKRYELELLLAFDEYAKQNSIAYSLGYGTLLGAARHKGFIPWDDDIDVIVPRPDYDRIVEAAKSGLEINGYKFVGYEIDKYPFPFLKLVNPNIVVKDAPTKDNIPLNLWMDVFPIDGCASDSESFNKQFSKAYFYRALIKTGNYKFLGAGRTRGKRMLKMLAMPFVTLFRLNDIAERRLLKFAKNNVPYDEADTYANLVWGPYENGEMISKEMMSGFTSLEFEDYDFPAIAEWDKLLTGLYGNYMELPSEEARVSHGVQAWIEEENK